MIVWSNPVNPPLGHQCHFMQRTMAARTQGLFFPPAPRIASRRDPPGPHVLLVLLFGLLVPGGNGRADAPSTHLSWTNNLRIEMDFLISHRGTQPWPIQWFKPDCIRVDRFTGASQSNDTQQLLRRYAQDFPDQTAERF